MSKEFYIDQDLDTIAAGPVQTIANCTVVGGRSYWRAVIRMDNNGRFRTSIQQIDEDMKHVGWSSTVYHNKNIVTAARYFSDNIIDTVKMNLSSIRAAVEVEMNRLKEQLGG